MNEKLLDEPGHGNDETVLPHWKLNRAAPFRLPSELQDLLKTKLKPRLEHCTFSTLRQILKDSRRKATGAEPELVRRIEEEVGPPSDHTIMPASSNQECEGSSDSFDQWLFQIVSSMQPHDAKRVVTRLMTI